MDIKQEIGAIRKEVGAFTEIIINRLDKLEQAIKPLFADIKVGDWVEFSDGEKRKVVNTLFKCTTDRYRGEVAFEVCPPISGECVLFLKKDGKHFRDATPTTALRIVPAPKPSGLTMTEAFDLLDSGKAKRVRRAGKEGIGWSVVKYLGVYTVVDEDGKPDNNMLQGIDKSDRHANDWYVVKR